MTRLATELASWHMICGGGAGPLARLQSVTEQVMYAHQNGGVSNQNGGISNQMMNNWDHPNPFSFPTSLGLNANSYCICENNWKQELISWYI